MARKTKAELAQQRAEADRIAWESFRPKLEALRSYAEALQLVANTPGPDSPGRNYYMNLKFLLDEFAVPLGSSYAEKAQYLRLVKSFSEASVLKAGTLQNIEDALQRAMEAQGSW